LTRAWIETDVHSNVELKGAGMKLDRKLRMGLIGGGPGAFIGEVHRKASRLDGEIELVAGAFDIDPAKSKQMGKNLALDPKRGAAGGRAGRLRRGDHAE
jgi:hypothetical protein